MSESSYWWTTSSSGDGAAKYTRADLSNVAKILAAVNGLEGVAPSALNALAGTVTGVNAVSINTGYALVDGKPYYNNAAAAVTIPTASGAGNTRIDRIVLRADWTAQTVRITKVAGVDASSPTPPAFTNAAGGLYNTSGTLYDILLYQARVDTSGTVTLTDERNLARIQTAGIAPGAITNALLGAGSVLAGNLDASVRFQKIAQVNGNGTGIVSIASIPATFTHLLIVAATRSTRTTPAGWDSLMLRFNDDAGTNYSDRAIGNLSSSVITSADASQTATLSGTSEIGGGSTGILAPNLFLIPAYTSTTASKQVLALSGAVFGSVIGITVSGWTSTAAINKISFMPSVSPAYYLTTDSVVSLYGIP